jgi:hypothetical protein
MLSSVIIILVSTTFLVQNQYYSEQTLHAAAHDNARTATERIASEVRSVMKGGFFIAGKRTLVVLSPMVLAVVCDRASALVHVYNEGGQAGIDTDEVAGVARLNVATGDWTYRYALWSTIDNSDGSAVAACAANGAVTTGAPSSFHTLRNLGTLFGSTPNEGEILMLFRGTTFRIQASVLEPGTLGLFRTSLLNPLIEFATGMDSTAQFQYRTGGATYVDTVASGSLVNIDAVRIVADARKRAVSGGQDDVTFGWSVNIVLPNVP